MAKITNEMRYKTAEERVKAYAEHEGLSQDQMGAVHAMMVFRWLALEAEEEKPEPCPFCGGKMGEGQSSDGRRVLICDNRNCGYITPKSNTRAEVISAHNRVARAVRAAKESESIKEDIKFVKGALNEIFCLQDGSVSKSCTNAWEAVNKIKRRFGMIRDIKE